MIERELIKLLQDSIVPDGYKLEEFDEADMYSPKFDTYFELKCGTIWLPRMMIERKKYNELMALTCRHRRYIISTPRGVYSFDLNNIVIPEDWWHLHHIKRHSTYYNREHLDGETYKEVAFLPLGWAKNITTQIGWVQGM